MGDIKINPTIHILFSFLLIVSEEDTSIVESTTKYIDANSPIAISALDTSQ